MIEKIKQNIEENKGNKVKVRFNTGRNKIEEFDATVKELYNFVFTLQTETEIKSFTYSDVLTNIVELHFKKWYN